MSADDTGGAVEKERREVEWLAYVQAAHDKGLCEYSGMRATQCQRTICDCFETPEGAAEIERRARHAR